MTSDYNDFLKQKRQLSGNFGFKPTFIPVYLFDFQKYLLEWALLKGRSGLFEDCGLGKSVQELCWGQNVIEKTNKSVLLLTPLAVSLQMLKEANKFQIDIERSKDGKISKKKIYVTNYERLHYFNPDDFSGIICDESSILKNFKGQIKNAINIFMRKIPYRLLATATAAPNDFIELGTSSEALGYLGYMDMLTKFFKNEQNNCSVNGRTKGMIRESIKWRLKKHAHIDFWRWVTSWSRAIRKPSDIGFKDDGFILPKLNIENYMIDIPGFSLDGYFPEFAINAIGLKEERQETRKTIKQRCEIIANRVNNLNDFFVIWCNLNDEGDYLEKIIPNAIQISGKDSDESKEEKLISFSNGEIKGIITKPKIGGFGLNWQHCNHVEFMPTHSYEQFYQAIRRCWRFGQKREVNVYLTFTKGYENVVLNLERKQNQADQMFNHLVKEMNNSLSLDRDKIYNKKEELPTWL